jgi:hypothetical protein
MMEGLHANSKGGPFTQRKHLVCIRGGAFKFKEEKKNHGVLSEMMEAFGEQKVAERKTKQP